MDFQTLSSHETNSSLNSFTSGHSSYRILPPTHTQKAGKISGVSSRGRQWLCVPFLQGGEISRERSNGGTGIGRGTNDFVVAKYWGWKWKHTGETKSEPRKERSMVVGGKDCAHEQSLSATDSCLGTCHLNCGPTLPESSLQIRNLRPHPRPTEWGFAFNKPTGWFASTFSLRSTELGHWHIFRLPVN